MFIPPHRKTADKGRPDYYITPTRDFTEYTRDCEEKYWNRETAFDWSQDVRANLKEHLQGLSMEEFSKVAFMVLPMVETGLRRQIADLQGGHLPLEEDALKAIGAFIPADRTTIQEALQLLAPLEDHRRSVSRLEDRLEILKSELLDLREQKRLGLYHDGDRVKQMETPKEHRQQEVELHRLNQRVSQTKEELSHQKSRYKDEIHRIKTEVDRELQALKPQLMHDLQASLSLLERSLQAGHLPQDADELARLKDLILKRQLRGLKDIANHALVVEQSAIAPLTMGIIHYKRIREIQEAMTTFINDEAKHSATFRRYLVEKLEAREYISDTLIKGADRYMWLARFMPDTGMFLAVIVEAIGAAYLEFFGEEEYMPDPLFRSISKTISTQDEKRHMDLCVGIYNELYRKGSRWERFKNRTALRVIMKSVYGDKTEDHHLIQAFQAFGVEADALYRHITGRLSEQLARISLYVKPQELLDIITRRS